MGVERFICASFALGLLAYSSLNNFVEMSTFLSTRTATIFTGVEPSWNTSCNRPISSVGSITNPSSSFGPRDPSDVGTWIGNNWVPPKQWKIYSATEMTLYFGRHSILFIGDSQTRRAFATMYEILNINTSASEHLSVSTLNDPNMLVIQKNGVTESCSRWTNHSVLGPIVTACRHVLGTNRNMNRYFDYVTMTCYKDLIPLIVKDQEAERIVSREYSLIIIAIGTWEAALPRHQRRCSPEVNEVPPFPLSTYARLNASLAILPKLASRNTTVVWRTVGFHEAMLNEEVNEACNMQAKSYIDQHQLSSRAMGVASNLTYVDWGKAIKPRSKLMDRIKGDNNFHYGFEGRYQYIQMLINALVEHDKQNVL